MSKERKEGDRVRESCVINGVITELWSLLRPFTFHTMPNVFESVKPLEGVLGEPNCVCIITYANGDTEHVRITHIQDSTHTIHYEVLGVDGRVICLRSLLLLPVSEKRQVFVEFISQYADVIPLKDFIDEQMKKRAFFKALRQALSINDETAPWDCPFCTTPNPPTSTICNVCKKRNYSRGIKWNTVKFDWLTIKDQQRVESEVFELCKYRWKVLLFPNGLQNEKIVGAFLNVVDMPEGESLYCEFFVRAVHAAEHHAIKGVDGELSRIHAADWTFTSKDFDRGFGKVVDTYAVESQFLSKDGMFSLQVGIGPRKRPGVQG